MRNTFQLLQKLSTMRFSMHLMLSVCLFTAFYSCREATVDAADYSCKANPPFIKSLGMNPARIAITTSETKKMGMLLKEFPATKTDTMRTYQHPSWTMAGWLAPLLFDKSGNIFTAPAPFVNMLENPVSRNNTIYKVDGNTGVMDVFLKLPVTDSANYRNPFGILSIAYNCKQDLLYVSTVSGSSLQEEKGKIYVIDAATKKIVDEMKGQDFFGIQVVVVDEKLRLLAGSTRNSNLYSIKLKQNGHFGSNPEVVASLEGLGLRGDDKIKKITVTGTDAIQIRGFEFDYNLIAPTEKQETIYNYIFDTDSQKWTLQR